MKFEKRKKKKRNSKKKRQEKEKEYKASRSFPNPLKSFVICNKIAGLEITMRKSGTKRLNEASFGIFEAKKRVSNIRKCKNPSKITKFQHISANGKFSNHLKLGLEFHLLCP